MKDEITAGHGQVRREDRRDGSVGRMEVGMAWRVLYIPGVCLRLAVPNLFDEFTNVVILT